MSDSKRAIIVFAKQPIVGTVKTRLAAALGAETATEIYRCALADTLELIEKCDSVARFLAYSPPNKQAENFFAGFAANFKLLPQIGESLGERIYNALARVAETNVEQMFVIGTDSPDLPLSHLEQAFAALDESSNDVVLGSTSDGGYYLIGMRAPHRILFERIAWSTETVAAQTRERADEGRLRLVEIEPWYDLDTVEDLLKLISVKDRDTQNVCRTRGFVQSLAIIKAEVLSETRT